MSFARHEAERSYAERLIRSRVDAAQELRKRSDALLAEAQALPWWRYVRRARLLRKACRLGGGVDFLINQNAHDLASLREGPRIIPVRPH